jgi:hypothetical protein
LEIKRAKRLEEENRLVLIAMEDSRKRVEDERAKAARSGDLKRMEASASSFAAAGRGRGVTNLPAWMTAQQEQQQHHFLEVKKSDGDFQDHDVGDIRCPLNNRKRNLFANPSPIVLLSNIEKKNVSELENEMQQECRKYGPVRACFAHDFEEKNAPKDEERLLQILVCFKEQESAVRACRDLDGNC